MTHTGYFYVLCNLLRLEDLLTQRSKCLHSFRASGLFICFDPISTPRISIPNVVYYLHLNVLFCLQNIEA